MTVLGIVILAIIFATVGLGAITLVRNEMVYCYRRTMLQDVSRAARADIAEGREWQWRYDVYDGVSYDTLVWKFWRRFDSFYPDQSFRQSNG